MATAGSNINILCSRCGQSRYPDFGLLHDLWHRIAREDAILCLGCVEELLHRPLTLADFWYFPRLDERSDMEPNWRPPVEAMMASAIWRRINAEPLG
jgi:hypothetical protein